MTSDTDAATEADGPANANAEKPHVSGLAWLSLLIAAAIVTSHFLQYAQQNVFYFQLKELGRFAMFMGAVAVPIWLIIGWRLGLIAAGNSALAAAAFWVISPYLDGTFRTVSSTLSLGVNAALLMMSAFTLLIWLVAICFNRKTLPKGGLIALGIFTLVFSAQNLGAFSVIAEANIDLSDTVGPEVVSPNAISVNPSELPHVVYIVPDRYASPRTLRKRYDLDISEFADRLRDRGFHVWDHQSANYTATFQSVAAVMNMTYLTEAAERMGTRGQSFAPTLRLMADHRSFRALKASGYRSLHMASWWDGNRLNPHADEVVSPYSLSGEFLWRYLFRSPIAMFAPFLIESSAPAVCALYREQAEAAMTKATADEPHFIYWHLFSVHDPYVYGADGSCREYPSAPGVDWEERKRVYAEQIEPTNQMLVEVFDHFQGQSDRPFIFVIQSDEGPYPHGMLVNRKSYSHWHAEASDTQLKFSIFNAMYLPSGDYPDAGQQTSPINNMRYVLNEALGLDLPFMEHRHYSFDNGYKYPFEFQRIDDRLTQIDPLTAVTPDSSATE
ncbi:MAG: sulfatase-like hydrolase/transferase [Alphaproteobacteria bacterium]|nr:sulfatase-like hydrolase/transferase [Alphaproteobacteria bacterium SS10]